MRLPSLFQTGGAAVAAVSLSANSEEKRMIMVLSLAQKAGQRLMAGFDGKALNADLKFLIHTLKVGGLILFSRNLGSPDEIRQLCGDVQDYARSAGQPPLIIAIDQEGGQVARLKAPFFSEFPGNPAIKTREDALNFAGVTASELRSIRVNMNYAPVLDVTRPDIPGIMAGRSFGSDPRCVAELGTAIIKTLEDNSILSVAKHFPGIGRTIIDSHLDLPVVKEDLEELDACDLIPFQAAIQSGVSGIMLSHILYEKLDRLWPASLSVFIARDLLRIRMRYAGLVMTDDLDMGAITRHYALDTAVDQVLLSEIDQILICHKSPAIEAAFEQIQKRIRDNASINSLSDQSVQRILAAKDRIRPCTR
jgi:beta-N-acetylhexosaminidase